MITTYKPLLDGTEFDRAGTVWISCDVGSCDREAEVALVAVELDADGGAVMSEESAPMPDGWVTSNVDDNAIAGAAQFCPDHASMVSSPIE